MAKYDQEAWNDYVTQFDPDSFQDRDLARRLEMMEVLGDSALPEDRFKRVN